MDASVLLIFSEAILHPSTVLRARGCAAGLLLSESPWRNDSTIVRMLKDWQSGSKTHKSIRDKWIRLSKSTGDPDIATAKSMAYGDARDVIRVLSESYDEQAGPMLYARCLDAAISQEAGRLSLAVKLAIAAVTMRGDEYASSIVAEALSGVRWSKRFRDMMSRAQTTLKTNHPNGWSIEADRIGDKLRFMGYSREVDLAESAVAVISSATYNEIDPLDESYSYNSIRIAHNFVRPWTDLLNRMSSKSTSLISRRLMKSGEPRLENAVVNMTIRGNPHRGHGRKVR